MMNYKDVKYKKLIYDEMNKEIIPLVDAIKCIPGLEVHCTAYKQYGADRPLIWVWFEAEKIENLEVISRSISRRYGGLDNESPESWICKLSDTEKEASMVLHSGFDIDEATSLEQMNRFIDNIFYCLESKHLVDHFELDESRIITRKELDVFGDDPESRQSIIDRIERISQIDDLIS